MLPERGVAPIKVSEDPWVLSTTDPQAADYRGAYLGNGYLGQRIMQSGTGLTGEQSEPAYVAGLYQNESLVTLPSLLPLQIRANGRLWGANLAEAKQYRQELRLREGSLVTTATWDTGAGEVDLVLNASMPRQRPQQAFLEVEVKSRATAPVEVVLPADLPGASAASTADASPQISFGAGGAVCRTTLRPTMAAAITRAASPALGYQAAPGQSIGLVLTTEVTVPGRRPIPDKAPPSRPLEVERAVWRGIWERDIEIDGDPEAQQIVRACLFYLLSSIRPDNEFGIPPMGLSGNAFSGHVFWDMDSWMFPALLPQHPEMAKAMLDYRFRTLPGARANAKDEGLPGASYAWESAATGRETIKGAVFSHGRHVTGDVALALKQYYAATGDKAWLRDRAWPILQPTAANWAARAKSDGKGGFYFAQVTTPDELADQVDHSAWTHHVARINLDFAAETARTLGQSADPKWTRVSKGLGFLRDPKTKLILPYEGFTERSKAKQADVLLLAHPGDLQLPKEELGKMYDYYVPRVIANGPAMTDAIHAIVAARLGRGEESLKRFRLSYQPFIRPPFHLFSEKRTRDNLTFLTGSAGVVEAVLYGFAGLRLDADPTSPDRPRLDPALPPGWTRLKLRNLHWRGRTWDVEIKPNAKPVWTPVKAGA